MNHQSPLGQRCKEPSWCLGTSVALHLIQKYPSAKVTLIDRTPFPSQVGASWDWKKVVRADYANLLYMELALEAMELWRSDPLYKPFYRESGLVWVDNKGFPQDIIDSYKKLNSTAKSRLIKAEEAKGLWDGIHADADYEGAGDMLLNESSGWAEASAALTKTIEHAVEAGVQYVGGDVEAVVFDDQGASTGVRTTKGDVLSASHIILATGATTAKLIADSVPKRPEMQVAGRVVAAAICTAMTILSDEEAESSFTS
ncbi:FAD/NAD(P)-binding domain-containing protein [Mollisia scopiformis]|uniref:FAD/NAD(P)-binding domain-containing protein n=1 Tax=Mollisia scopiformis TaxID=149040 RepID=A0A194XVG7_MOLSC|nr:FAD/NAD(P)-binding domain-containing protein [Mollisia scopiformis]KUJ24004.1 FAD/NAD(P)-binding domain-containing protein [Mollisia scopiformis]